MKIYIRKALGRLLIPLACVSERVPRVCVRSLKRIHDLPPLYLLCSFDINVFRKTKKRNKKFAFCFCTSPSRPSQNDMLLYRITLILYI